MLGLKDGNLAFSEDKTRQGASRRWIMQAVEESLTRLKTDYIDLYQVHVADPETPREETLRALDDLVRQGKVRAIGEAATFATADDLNASQAIAAANGLTPFATMEANYSILVRDAEKTIIPALRDYKMWRPLVVPPTNQDAKSKEKTHGMTIRAIIGRTSIHSVFWLLCTNSGVIRYEG
jgi:aryl-alcohol dehydrogenase-like predicted oxidoreductase